MKEITSSFIKKKIKEFKKRGGKIKKHKPCYAKGLLPYDSKLMWEIHENDTQFFGTDMYKIGRYYDYR